MKNWKKVKVNIEKNMCVSFKVFGLPIGNNCTAPSSLKVSS